MATQKSNASKSRTTSKNVKKKNIDNKKNNEVNKKENVVSKKEKVVIKTSPSKKIVVEEQPITVEKNSLKKEKKHNKDNKFINFFKDFDNSMFFVIAGIVGFLLSTLIFRLILWPDRIATLKDGTQPIATIDGETITADDLYMNMREKYALNIFLEDLDTRILSKKYTNKDEIETEAVEQAESYYSYYSQTGYTKESFLSANGFKDEQEFIDLLSLNVLRNKYYEEYARSLVTDKEIDKYYENDVYGDVNTEHLLVTVSSDDSGLSDDDAKKLAKEIIAKLNGGAKWSDVVEEYKDKTTHEELGFQAFNASLESNYLEEMKNLEVGKYSSEPVKTSYGYHIVYKLEQKDKPSLDTVKEDIIDILAEELKDNDENLYYKALEALRNENNLVFSDTVIEEEYNEYINQYK